MRNGVCLFGLSLRLTRWRSGLFIDIYLSPSVDSIVLSLPGVEMKATCGERPPKRKILEFASLWLLRGFYCCFFYFVNINRRLWANPKGKRERDKCLRKIKTSFILFHDSWFCLEVEARTLSLSFFLFFARPSLRVCLSFIPVLFLNKFRCAIPFPLFLVVVLLLLFVFFLFH